MTLLHPIWLVLIIPFGILLWLWKLPSRSVLILRTLLLVFLLLAISGWSLWWPSRSGNVVVVVDRSLSVPDSERNAIGVINIIQKQMSANEKLAVLGFGRDVTLEPLQTGEKFTGFAGKVDRDGSYLTEALEKALAMIPKGEPGRILLISDGQWTGKGPNALVTQAAARGIAIDFRRQERPATGDLGIVRIDAPAVVTARESFLLNLWVQSSTKQNIQYELWRDNKKIAKGTQEVNTGLNRLTFRDQASEPGTAAYELRIVGESDDPIPENNFAKALIGVKGPKSVLLVSSSDNSALKRILQDSKINVQLTAPESFDWSIDRLSNYSAVILENVPSQRIGNVGMQTLSTWVQESGAGLFMTGGQNSFAPGGYYKSPLESILPVSMELRQEHRKLQLAIIVTLDRSGSMAMPVGGGRAKMDLANLGTAQVLDLLGPMDELGVIAVDSSPHVIQEIGPISDKATTRSKILGIRSMGGGIFIDVALQRSYQMFAKAKAGTKHLILFSDAADSEQPGNYREILAAYRAKGITVSVIGLGNRSNKDGALLEEIAKLGNGRCFFTESPEELPRLFAQDTFVVSRSSFITDVTPVKMTAGMNGLAQRQFGKTPPVGGYNLCYLRPDAMLAAVTTDEYNAPLVASWQAGMGRVVCYTGEVDGEFTGPIGNWADYGSMLSSLTRWTAGQSKSLPGGAVLTQQLRKGVAEIKLHLDPERQNDNITTLPEITVLRASPGETPSVERSKMRWLDADTLAYDIPLPNSATAMATVKLPGTDPVTLSPICLPYSPEFAPVKKTDGAANLEKMAKATGGRERLEVADIWNDIPRHPILVELAPWLLLFAVLLLLLEVLERRTSLISSVVTRFPHVVRKSWAAVTSRRPKSPRYERMGSAPAESEKGQKPSKKAQTTSKEKSPAPSEPPKGVLGALQKVKDKNRRN